jgi:hypothetical protein
MAMIWLYSSVVNVGPSGTEVLYLEFVAVW